MPGLALALVHGEQIVHLGGYGKADQTGREVTPQTPGTLSGSPSPSSGPLTGEGVCDRLLRCHRMPHVPGRLEAVLA